MSEQYLSTSRLVNVIQLIALGRQTGVLKVFRGQNSTREQAEIHFSEGRPTFAILGQLTGNAALTVLQNWGECQYAFLEGPLPSPEPPAKTGAAASSSSPTSALPRRQTTGPSFFTGPFPPAPTPDPRTAGRGATSPFSARRGNEWIQGTPTPPPAQREALRPQFVPKRLTSVELLDGLPLDRRERMVLLLIDGRRNVADLVRLTRRGDDEVQLVLAHLLALGLIE
jgi:hypothetical protein